MFLYQPKVNLSLILLKIIIPDSPTKQRSFSTYKLFPASSRNEENVDENCSTSVSQNVLEQRRCARENQLRKIESKNRRTTRGSAAPTSCLVVQKKFANQQKKRIRMRDLGKPVNTSITSASLIVQCPPLNGITVN
jgi:hypothetical protein